MKRGKSFVAPFSAYSLAAVVVPHIQPVEAAGFVAMEIKIQDVQLDLLGCRCLDRQLTVGPTSVIVGIPRRGDITRC